MQDAPLIVELKKKVPAIAKHWNQYSHIFKEISVPARTVLLPEGTISQYIYLVQEGCLRLWYNDKGKDVTFQFFFENDAVSSLESYRFDTPSLFNLETIEPSILLKAHKDDVAPIFEKFPEAKDYLIEVLVRRVSRYTHLFLSRIRDTPEARYRDLIKMEPRIPNRIPQHYIASYLGITPVSLSRIKNRVWNQQS